MIITTIVGTFIQRLSIFVLTYIVYCGLGFRTAGMADVILLQAAIYVAVDMLPIPGAQGVTEAMYKNVFRNISVENLWRPCALSGELDFIFCC